MSAWPTGTAAAGGGPSASEPSEAPQANGERLPPGELTPRAVLLAQIQAQAVTETLRLTVHAREAMRDEAITLDDVLETIATGQILEDYPEHRRGACCLLGGQTRGGRPVHLVCTSTQPVLVLITVYEPQPPKWLTPTQRRSQG
jgi:hypothetical protein